MSYVGCRFTLSTYRDPNPAKSLAAFDECLQAVAGRLFDSQTVEKAIAGTYSNLIQPKTPRGRGSAAFLRQLYLIDSKDILASSKILLSIKAADLQKAARRLLKERKKKAKSVLIIPKGSAQADIEI